MPPATTPGRYYAKVVGKALAALDVLRAAPGPLSLGELTAQLGLAKTSLFRILHTLQSAGYVERDAAGLYRVPATLRATAGEQQRQLAAAALPVMTALHREFGETISLAMLFENHIEVIATIESTQLVRMGNTVGRILPPHASSLGKAITAFQSDARRDSLIRSYGLHRFTAHTITDIEDLKREFQAVRRRGHSLDAEESALEGCCFGVPVRGTHGEVIGALSLSLPKRRLRPPRLRGRIVAALGRAAASVSRSFA